MSSRAAVSSSSEETSGPFNGVKVFSATMFADRERLGDKVTDWIKTHPRCAVVELVVTQSSDAQFHCVAITVFYREDIARA
jgi:hypothetical protein